MRLLTIAVCGLAAWTCEPPVSDYSGEPGEQNEGPPIDEEATDINDVLVEKWAVWANGRVHADIVHDGRLGPLFLAVGEEQFGAYGAGRRYGSLGFGGFGLPGAIGMELPRSRSSHLELSERPDVIRVLNDVGVELTTIPVGDQVVLGPNETCNQYVGKDACEPGTLCAYAVVECDGDGACLSETPSCRPVSVIGRHFEETGIRLRINGASQVNGYRFEVGGFQSWGVFSGTLDDSIDIVVPNYRAETADLYDGFDLIMADVPIEPLGTREEGQDCDRTEFSNVCAEGLLCGESTCEPSIAPAVESVTAVYDGQSVGLRIVGTDPNLDVCCLRGELSGPGGFFFSGATYDDISAGSTSRFSLEEGNQFVWEFTTPRPSNIMEDTVGAGMVMIRDWQGLRSEPFELDLQPDFDAPTLTLGEACDQAGIFNQCPDGSRCEVRSKLRYQPRAEDDSRCEIAEPVCPEGTAETLTLETPIVVEAPLYDLRPANVIYGSTTCDSSRGAARMYNFTASAEGSYRFTVTQEEAPGSIRGGFSFAIKDSCLHQFADLGCTLVAPYEAGAADVQVDLSAGQTIAIAVKRLYAFELTVEKL